MSGADGRSFVRRLVARHTAEPAVRPRARARFEPDPAGGWAERATFEPPADPRRVRGERLDAAALPRPAPIAVDRPPEPAARAFPANELAIARPAGRARAGAPDLLPAPSAGAASAVHRQPAVPSPSTPSPGPEAIGPLERPRRERLAAAERALPLRRQAETRGAQPAAVRLEGRSALDNRRAAAPPREPDVVHVHIGRVEIRGAIASPAAAASVPAGPTERGRRESGGPLPLDRYLARERTR